MDKNEIIKVFNRVMTSSELGENILYKIVEYVVSKNGLKLREGGVSVYEIRSHILDNKINNNYLVRINKNQFFSFGINECFDKIDYVLRTYFDLFEEITKLQIEDEVLFSSTHAIINLDIFDTREVAKIIVKNEEGYLLRSPLNIINVNLFEEYQKILDVLTEEERNHLINVIKKY